MNALLLTDFYLTPNHMINLPLLIRKVKHHLPKYNSQKEYPIANDPYFSMMEDMLRHSVLQSVISDPSYWKDSGIRYVPYETFCANFHQKHFLGEGSYGMVYKVSNKPCIANLPDVHTVCIKYEVINSHTIFQKPSQIKMSIDIIHLASELGIGPKLYDYFISEDEFNQCTLVKVYEFIDGDTWFHSTWPTKSDYQIKVAELKDLVKRMNAAGIIHNDLHLNNVMINSAGRVYIIDYDRAVFATEYETIKMEEKLVTSDVNTLGVFDAKCIRFLYLSMVKDGSIVTYKKKRSLKTVRHYTP